MTDLRWPTMSFLRQITCNLKKTGQRVQILKLLLISGEIATKQCGWLPRMLAAHSQGLI